VALWIVVVLLLLRGAADLTQADDTAPPAREARPAAIAWPDEVAKAYAVEFARAYLTQSPRQREQYMRALGGFVAPELLASVVPETPEDAEPQAVQTATVAGSAALDDRHALVTVAATVSSDEVTTRYLVVPVGRDGGGGLTVYDLPSFAPPAPEGLLSATQGEPLTGADRAPIEDVVERFLRAFLAGREDELDYLVPAGTQIGALAQPHELAGAVSVIQLEPEKADARVVLATVRARDVSSEAVYALRYRLSLVRKDRWYVAAINDATRKGG
jgi:Conjugative transposon protein TcpC